VIAFIARFSPPAMRAAVLALASAVVASCGGSVSPSTDVVDPAKITILPGTAVMYSGLPTTFSITGGTGVYIVTSSNQAVLPVSGSLVGNSLTLIPNQVTADSTEVTLTVRDTGTTVPASALVTVRPGTVNNAISIVPTATQADCTAPAICSGGDALVTVTLSQGGIPLPARGVRFEAVSGDFRFVTSASGVTPEVLEVSGTTVTDETGKARLRLRVLPAAPNQTALLKVTDLGTLAFRQASFVIAQVTAGGGSFFTIPTSVTFTGSRVGACVSGIASDFLVFGGAPPYTVSSANGNVFAVSPTAVAGSGGRFSVIPTGICSSSTTIAITDSAGRTITVTAVNQPPAASSVPAFAVSPVAVLLDSCSTIASVTVVGGTGTYLQPTSSNSGVIARLQQATLGSATVSIQRLGATPAILPTPPATTPEVTVAVTDGATVTNVKVTLAGAGAGACP
jgi:hypothetical protein